MELLKREQIAGMNIHYLFYPLEYFWMLKYELESRL